MCSLHCVVRYEELKMSGGLSVPLEITALLSEHGGVKKIAKATATASGQGWTAGLVLHVLLQLEGIDKPVSLRAATAAVEKIYKTIPKWVPASKKKGIRSSLLRQKVFPQMRPAVHFWAAYVCSYEEKAKGGLMPGAIDWSMSFDSIRRFLGLAAGFAAFAERVGVVDKDELWRFELPTGRHIEPVVAPEDEDLKTFLSDYIETQSYRDK